MRLPVYCHLMVLLAFGAPTPGVQGAPDGAREFRPIWNTVLNLRDDRLTVFGATRMEESQHAVFLAVTAIIQE